MGIKTVPHPPYRRDVAPSDFCLFPKLRGCRYETIEEMKEAVTKAIDILIQEDFHGALKKLLERYNKCIAAGGDYFEGDKSFMCVLSIKVPIRKKSGNLFNDPRIEKDSKESLKWNYQKKKRKVSSLIECPRILVVQKTTKLLDYLHTVIYKRVVAKKKKEDWRKDLFYFFYWINKINKRI